MKLFKAFSPRLANYLVKNNFTVLRIEPNLKKIGLDVWVFEDSKELRETYAEYCKNF